MRFLLFFFLFLSIACNGPGEGYIHQDILKDVEQDIRPDGYDDMMALYGAALGPCYDLIYDGGQWATIAINCDDGYACTDDSCDLIEGCAHEKVACDDGDPCTADYCDQEDGSCYSEPTCP